MKIHNICYQLQGTALKSKREYLGMYWLNLDTDLVDKLVIVDVHNGSH
jgi:hypothetical protein